MDTPPIALPPPDGPGPLPLPRLPALAPEWQLEIIGEAFTGLRRVDPGLAASIPDLPRIVAFRNVLIHSYATVDSRLVWGVVEGKLSGLPELLTRLLGDEP